MLRSTALLLLALSLGNAAVVLEDGMPILWAHTTDQPSDLPIENNVLNPNPWHYLHRMSLYRLMIDGTNEFMGPMGPGPTESPMWGLALQLGWMLTSGRLGDPTGATTCGLQTGDTMCISTSSWWACENYFVSVLPFLSAAQNGFLGDGAQVQMQIPAGVDEYCTTYEDCKTRFPDAMTKWDAFFQALRASRDSPQPDNEKKDSLLGLYWEAQMASTHASAVCNAKQTNYSPAEMAFALHWLNSAEYVAPAHFHSNLEKSAMFLTPLPGRVLTDSDVAPNIPDMTPEENHTLQTFGWMNRMNTLLGGSLVSMWRKAMCSVTTREKGREMLEQILLDSTYVTTSFLAIVTSMSTSC